MEQQQQKKASVVLAIGSFDKKKLKPSATTLTTDQGDVFIEELTADGIYRTKEVRRNKDLSYRQPKPSTAIDTSPVMRFGVEDPAWIDFLLEHGYVVFGSVADQEQFSTAKTKLWEFLELKLGWKRDDPSTWDTHSLAAVGMPHTGIINGGGVGHCDMQWYVRCLPKVQEAFKSLWSRLAKDSGCDLAPDNLLTSFDGINVFRPWQRDISWKTQSGWTHVDQGRNMKGMHCVQGLVTLTDASTQTGGFVCVPGSHRHHSEIVNSLSTSDQNYVRVPLDCAQLPAELQNKLRFVSAQAGDLILWDSRTVHANIPALETPTTLPDKELLRAVSYICMTPKALASKEVLQARRLAFEEGITTGHWPHLMPLGNGSAFGVDCSNGEVETERLANAPEEIRKLVG